MRIKLEKKRKKYNCIVEELDYWQISNLERKIQEKDTLEPWLLKFVERFHSLANEKGYSKKMISDFCERKEVRNPLLRTKDDSFPASTLSTITNPESDNLRLPNINHLIMLSKCFDVSIDYLVGKTDCIHPEYEDTHETTGLPEDSIQTLKLKKSC